MVFKIVSRIISLLFFPVLYELVLQQVLKFSVPAGSLSDWSDSQLFPFFIWQRLKYKLSSTRPRVTLCPESFHLPAPRQNWLLTPASTPRILCSPVVYGCALAYYNFDLVKSRIFALCILRTLEPFCIIWAQGLWSLKVVLKEFFCFCKLWEEKLALNTVCTHVSASFEKFTHILTHWTSGGRRFQVHLLQEP